MDANDTNFEEKVIEKSKKILVVVDFWASWCVPCNMLSPALEKAVDSYGDKAVLVKINVDECPEISNKFDISAIPAVKLFKDGKIAEEFVGVIPEDSIKKIIDKALK